MNGSRIPTTRAQKNGRLRVKAAVIGAGIAGLRLAQLLSRDGLDVQVFDKARARLAGWPLAEIAKGNLIMARTILRRGSRASLLRYKTGATEASWLAGKEELLS